MATIALGAAIQRGVLASRPASGDATKAGQLYFATDEGIFYHDDGASWVALLPADLIAIAGLTLTDDDLLQRKAGAWTNRTPAQLKTDLALNNVANLKVNLAATAAPAVTDDSGDGYAVGSRWLDTTNDKEYVCLDATAGAAVWTETTATGGGGALTVEEVDGSPTDSAVTKLVFPNGTLAIASHIATYTPAGGGGALTQIATQDVASAVASVTFSSIPGTYRDLVLVGVTRTDSANASDHIQFRANGDTGANYDWQTFVALGTTNAAAEGIGVTFADLAEATGGGTGTAIPGSFTLDIADYAGTTFHKSFRATSVARISTGGSGQRDRLASGFWRSTAAITSLTAFPAAGNFVAGSRFALYGRS